LLLRLHRWIGVGVRAGSERGVVRRRPSVGLLSVRLVQERHAQIVASGVRRRRRGIIATGFVVTVGARSCALLSRGHPSNQHTRSLVQRRYSGGANASLTSSSSAVYVSRGLLAELVWTLQLPLRPPPLQCSSHSRPAILHARCESDAGAIQAVLGWRQAWKLRSATDFRQALRYPSLPSTTSVASKAVVSVEFQRPRCKVAMMTGRHLEYEVLTGRKCQAS
jgi:hypothetical protein